MLIKGVNSLSSRIADGRLFCNTLLDGGNDGDDGDGGKGGGGDGTDVSLRNNNDGGGDSGDNGGDGGGDNGGDSGGGEITALDPNWKPDSWQATLTKGMTFEEDGEKDKVVNLLNRYQSHSDFVDGFIEARTQLSKGPGIQVVELPDDNATEAEVALFREKAGIPDSPDKYEYKLDDGLVVKESDQPVLDNMLQAFHDSHLRPAQVNNILNAYYKAEEAHFAALSDLDAEDKKETARQLREEWGSDYKDNVAVLASLMRRFDAPFAEAIINARTEGGTRLLNDPASVKVLVDLERTVNPTATIVEGDGPGTVGGIISAIEDMEENIGTKDYDPKQYAKLIEAGLRSGAIVQNENGGWTKNPNR